MKKFLIIVLLIMISITLVGCTEKEETDNTIDRTTEKSEPVGDELYYDYGGEYYE